MDWHGAPVGESREREPVVLPGRPAAFAGEEAVRYTATVEDPRDPDEDAAALVLAGLYAHAEVELTADRLGGEGPLAHGAYFEPLCVPFRPEGPTDVTVTCRAPEDRFGGLHDTDAVPPEAAVPAPWWTARVESYSLPAVVDLRVRPVVTDDGARLDVRTTVLTDGPVERQVTYSVRPEGELSARGTMDRTTVETSGPGLTTVEHSLDLRDPALWWPRSLGPQHRYTVTAKLDDDRTSATTGVRSVTREGGRFLVNGEPVPVRGVNLLTGDPADVERAVEANATLVRGHAYVLPPAVYEACDEAGLLVWQDLPLTGPGGFDPERGAALAERLADRYGSHPSLAAVGVHDDPVDAFADGLGGGVLDRLRLRWRAWRSSYDRTDADRVAEAVPDDLPTVPVVGGPGVDHDAAAYYPGRDYGAPADIDRLLNRYPATLLAEFGAPAPAPDPTAPDEPDATRADGARDPSGEHQATVLGTIAERARRRGVGAVAFALRDIAEGPGMGVYAADGTPKAARDRLAEAFEPVQVVLSDADPTLVVCNDRPEPLSTTLTWTAGEETGSVEVEAEPMGRWTGTPALPSGELEVELPVGDRVLERSLRR